MSRPSVTPDVTTRTAGRALAGVGSGNFRLLWFGEGISVLGSATTGVLLPLLAVVELDAGPGLMGALTALAWLPWLLIGLPAGAWVDRMRPRTVMIVADLVSAVTLLTVPVAWWLGWLNPLHLIAVAFCGGVATVFFRTAYVSIIPMIVVDRGLETANARLIGTESVMQITGPGLAGFLAQRLSASGGLLTGVVGFLVSALCLWRIRPADRITAVGPEESGTLVSRIAAGVRFVVHDRVLRTFTIIGGISNLGLTGYTSLLVLHLVRGLGLTPGAVGVVMMIGSCGGLLGSLCATAVARRIGTGRASTVFLLVAGPSAVLIGIPTDGRLVALTVTGLVLVGLGVVAGNVIRAAWRQRYVPSQLMGRVVTATQVVNFGTMPVAGFAAGWLGTEFGVRPTILIMAGIHALACVGILLTRLGRTRNLPTSPEASA